MKSHFLFLIAAIFIHTTTAQGFTLIVNGQNESTIGWKKNTVTFDIDVSCNSYLTKVKAAIEVAKNTWGAVPTSGLTVETGTTVTLPNPITTYVGNSATSYAPVGNPIIYCDSSFAANSGANANSIPGFAAGHNINSSGQLVGTLLVLNVQNGATANITTLSTETVNVVLTHEIGHCLGIGHSSDGNSLMYYQTGAGRKTVLSKDDMDAVTYLHPKQDLTGALACARIQSVSNNQNGNGLLNFLINDILIFALGFATIKFLNSKNKLKNLTTFA